MRGLVLLAGLAFCVPAWVPAGAVEPPLESIHIAGPASQVDLTMEGIQKLPAVQVEVAFQTEHGPRQSKFGGPTLWSVLESVHAVDPAKAKDAVRQIVILSGKDDYTAILALGEISPAFEGKSVILADEEDGKPLANPRIVVPGDKRGGRSVFNVVKIVVLAPPD
jgi:hypothetical protein